MTADLWKSLWGGMLIGAGAAALLLLNGKIAGISGIAENAVRGLFGESGWRIAFLLGLVILVYTIPRWRRRAAAQEREPPMAAPAISDADQQRLAADLANRD